MRKILVPVLLLLTLSLAHLFNIYYLTVIFNYLCEVESHQQEKLGKKKKKD